MRWDIERKTDPVATRAEVIETLTRVIKRLQQPRMLKFTPKREQSKYMVLLSNDTAIIDTEWEAMKTAKKMMREKPHLTIVEMVQTDTRAIAQTTVLSKLLEANEKPLTHEAY